MGAHLVGRGDEYHCREAQGGPEKRPQGRDHCRYAFPGHERENVSHILRLSADPGLPKFRPGRRGTALRAMAPHFWGRPGALLVVGSCRLPLLQLRDPVRLEQGDRVRSQLCHEHEACGRGEGQGDEERRVRSHMQTMPGGKATEWVPILPGTDLAVILAMCNIIVNKVGRYDEEFLKKYTNGPYLVGPDQRFVRDRDTGQPMLWDESDDRAKTWNDPTLSSECALLGDFEVQGVKCRPAFHLLREHLRQYEPAWAREGEHGSGGQDRADCQGVRGGGPDRGHHRD